MAHIAAGLAPHYARMRILNIGGEGKRSGWRSSLKRLKNSILAWTALGGSDVVYIAVKAGRGMWLTAVTAGLARILGANLILHHHSYIYVQKRLPRMVALTRIAGPSACHIVLSQSMKRDLTAVMPEIRNTIVINNAGLVDRSLSELPLKMGGDLVLGHLSNLSINKGIVEVVDLAIALHRVGRQVRLVVGGPIAEGSAGGHLDRAGKELGDRFDYRGPLSGDAKRTFFADITHFVFPTRYVHEAVPLVLYEAMAAGAVCLTTDRGSIAEQMSDAPGLVARDADSFVAEAIQVFTNRDVGMGESLSSRMAYQRAFLDSKRQLAELVNIIAAGR